MAEARTGPAGRVAALVLTWNSADLIERCIASLLASADAPHVTVVDNASTDGTEDLLRRRFPEVEVLQTGENLGFAGGCNVGLRHLLAAGFGSVLLLNPDAYVRPDCIELLAEHLALDQRCGAVSPVILDHVADGPATVWFGGGTIDWATGATYHRGQGEAPADLGAAPLPTDRINGGAVLLRASALRDVGLFDTDYFLYYEETDLSVRLTRAGWHLAVLPASLAVHESSSSTGGNLGRIYNYYLTRGRLLFLRKQGSSVRWSRVWWHLARETRWLTKTFGLRRTAPAVRQRARAVLHFALHRTGRVRV